MPKVVDKEQKRKDIAASCSELMLEEGIKNLTVAEVAKTAGIGKGTVYEYFKNKEDMVFEIINSYIAQFQIDIEEKLSFAKTSREKVFVFFDFILSKDEEYKKHQEIYKEYLGINLSSKNEAMSKFNTDCSAFFTSELEIIIKEGIEKKELKDEALELIHGLLAVEKGFLLIGWTEHDQDIKHQLTKFINTIFDLVETGK